MHVANAAPSVPALTVAHVEHCRRPRPSQTPGFGTIVSRPVHAAASDRTSAALTSDAVSTGVSIRTTSKNMQQAPHARETHRPVGAQHSSVSKHSVPLHITRPESAAMLSAATASVGTASGGCVASVAESALASTDVSFDATDDPHARSAAETMERAKKRFDDFMA